MGRFSLTTREFLNRAGWHEGRKIDTSPYEHQLQAGGYQLHRCVLEFLGEFGGLTFTDTERDWGGTWHFCVDQAIQRANAPKILKRLSPIVGSPLCVIGDSYNEYLLLLMDEEGRVFGEYDQLFFVGESGDDAIEALCEDQEMPELEEEETEQ